MALLSRLSARGLLVGLLLLPSLWMLGRWERSSEGNLRLSCAVYSCYLLFSPISVRVPVACSWLAAPPDAVVLLCELSRSLCRSSLRI